MEKGDYGIMAGTYLETQPAPIHWGVGWADLMMTMFIVFLVMYLFHSAPEHRIIEQRAASPLDALKQDGPARKDPTTRSSVTSGNIDQDDTIRRTAEGQNRGGSASEYNTDQSRTEMVRLYDSVVLTLRDNDLAKFADIRLSPDRTVRIVLAADLLFPSGNADLGSTARENIRKLTLLLQKTQYMINVVGHTDNIPIKSGPFATNWELSVMRATRVARFLIEEMGIAASQLIVTGRSYHQPQVNNDTPVNRAKNRRVEIIVSREQLPAIPVTSNPVSFH